MATSNVLLVDSWLPSGELVRVGESGFAFAGYRPVIEAPGWWPTETV